MVQSMGGTLEDTERRVRRLRKKLLQIENLEVLNRELNEEEETKVSKKSEVRAELHLLIKEIEMKRGPQSEPKSPKKVAKTEPNVDQHSNANNAVTINQSTRISANRSAHQPVVQTTTVQEKITEPCVTSSAADTSKPIAASSKSSPKTSASKVTSSTTGTSTLPDVDPLSNGQRSVTSGSSAVSQQSAEAKQRLNEEKKRHEHIKSWRRRRWRVQELEGHEDLILDCDIDLEQQLAVTASRDTTLKTWDLSSGCLQHSLRGHTGPVTGCQLTTWANTDASGPTDPEFPRQEQPEFVDNQLICVSASSDCSLKLWNLDTGTLVKSIYTFNGISKLKIIRSLQVSISGTDGGKLEMYSLQKGIVITSVKAHHEAISALSVLEGKDRTLLGSGSEDGIIKIYKLEKDSLSCIYVSENVNVISPNSSLHSRPIYSIYISDSEVLYYGDNGHNIKMLDWKNNQVLKFSNHTIEHGFTDSIAGLGELVVATSFDIDTGLGQLNIYSERPDQIPQYLATLSDSLTNRISVLRSSEKDGKTYVTTAGLQLKVWESDAVNQTRTQDTSTSVQGCVLALGDCPVLDSGSEDGGDTEDDEDRETSSSRSQSLPLQKPAAGFCNCQVM